MKNIVITAAGTRGDVQPMIALGIGLRAAGYAVRIVAGSNFAQWIEAHGLDFYPTVDMEALMQSEAGVRWVESTRQFDQMRRMRALTHSIIDQTVRDTLGGTQGADALIGGFIAEPYLQAVSEKHKLPQITVALQPYRASTSGPASILALRPRTTSILNRWSGMFAERVTWSVAAVSAGRVRQALGLPPHTAASYVRAVRAVPALYAISPHVVPPADDNGTHTTGYLFHDESYTPPDDLMRFLDAGDPPVYVGFGSMSSSDPARTVQLVAEALARVGRRGVLARGWSGADVSRLPDHVFALDRVSHTWLFLRTAAVVHHGGAGTTAAGLRAGRPTLIVPHMADQPYWGRRLHDIGVSPRPLPRQKLTLDALTERLRALLTDRALHDRAAALGDHIRAEKGVENAVAFIDGYLRER